MPSTSTQLNPTQLHLLKMFSYAKTDRDLDDIKSALSAYFASNIDKAMDQLWDDGTWDNNKNEAILNEHLRTHYAEKRVC